MGERDRVRPCSDNERDTFALFDTATAERDASEPDVKLNRSLQETLNNLYYI